MYVFKVNYTIKSNSNTFDVSVLAENKDQTINFIQTSVGGPIRINSFGTSPIVHAIHPELLKQQAKPDVKYKKKIEILNTMMEDLDEQIKDKDEQIKHLYTKIDKFEQDSRYEKEQYACPYCIDSFKTPEELIEHIKIHIPKEVPEEKKQKKGKK